MKTHLQFYGLGLILACCTGFYYGWGPLLVLGLLTYDLRLCLWACTLKLAEILASRYRLRMRAFMDAYQSHHT